MNRDSTKISSQYFTDDNLTAEAFAVKGSGGAIWTTKSYQDSIEVANLTFGSFEEADQVAAEWSWK